ncbi:MAG: hypothetical protein N3B01_08725 [Verrucomicrobiae bacterium]|nr:hypothetical protein [Verrucomicrobiae bacterium]
MKHLWKQIAGFVRWTIIVGGAAAGSAAPGGLESGISGGAAGFPQRQVCPIERGSIWMIPQRNDWSSLGIYVGSPRALRFFHAMRPDAIKVPHGRFQHFCPKDETAWAFFPFSELKAYEAREVAAGRAPIFVTATYAGRKRPVYFRWSLEVDRAGEKPTVPKAERMQAVNVSDERFLRFWIERYARRLIPPDLANVWIGLDVCAVIYSLYGVLDDEGRFVPGVPWDPPFPRNKEAWADAYRSFFTKLKQAAPEIKVICNVASMDDWRWFPHVYADAPGIMAEDIVHFLNVKPTAYIRAQVYHRLQWYQWAAQQNKLAILRAIIEPNEEARVRTACATYLIVRGPNFFFAPQGPKGADIVPFSPFERLCKNLGAPVGQMQSVLDDKSAGEGYRLYSRRYQNGIVFLNLTGKQMTVPLPQDKTYYDRHGRPVAHITLEDLQGDYVLSLPQF